MVELMATVMVVAVTAVIRARRPLIWVMPTTAETCTDWPTTSTCAPSVMTADEALVMPVIG